MEAWWPVNWQDGSTAGGKGGAATAQLVPVPSPIGTETQSETTLPSLPCWQYGH